MKLVFLIPLLLVFLAGSVSGMVFVAKGDTAVVNVSHPSGTCWFFPVSESGIYDVPSGNYTCELYQNQTDNMLPGVYDVIYTYPAIVNGAVIKDISWKNNQLVSIFTSVPAINEEGKQGRDIMADLIQLTNDSKTDGYEQYKVQIQNPYLTITRNEQVNDTTIRVSGTSNMRDGTMVKIIVDEQAHVAQKNLQNFTFFTGISRLDTETDGLWKADMILPLQDLAPGAHEVNAYANELATSVQFPIYQTWEPAPTPTQYINYFGNGSIKPEIVTVTITIHDTVMVDRWHTATPTPMITDALGYKINYPYTPSTEESPKTGGIMLVFLVIAAILVAVKK